MGGSIGLKFTTLFLNGKLPSCI